MLRSSLGPHPEKRAFLIVKNTFAKDVEPGFPTSSSLWLSWLSRPCYESTQSDTLTFQEALLAGGTHRCMKGQGHAVDDHKILQDLTYQSLIRVIVV